MDISANLLYLDDALLAVNKPAGLPTLPDGYHPEAPCLVNLLKAEFPALWTVHRLDKETSGVIVFARSADAHRALNMEFDSRETAKVYHAIVRGSPEWDEHTVDLRLRPNGDRRHRTVIDARGGKEARTELGVLRRCGGYTLIQARPRTGRTHQIRAHLAAVGLPIVGDDLYGRPAGVAKQDRPNDPFIHRVALHAWSLELTHPQTGARLTIHAPYPADFEAALAAISC